MSDVLHNPYPQRAIDPNEPGLVAGYTFGDRELAQFGRYLNRASTGAVYDLTMRSGTPIVGHGGGVAPLVSGNRHYRAGSYTTGPTESYVMEGEEIGTSGVGNWRASNGDAHGFINWPANLTFSMNFPGSLATCPFSLVGRGPYRASGLYDGTNQILVINGISVARVAVAPSALGASSGVGGGYTTRKFLVYDARHTVAQARASYVMEFARPVVHSWKPSIVGEGPAGGIATGMVGEGDWYCPSGGATFRFVWVGDPRLPRPQLALTEPNNNNFYRLEFMHTKMPSFGTWRAGVVCRSLTAVPDFYLATQRNQAYANAGSTCYWGRLSVVGGLWSWSWYYENGAALLTAVNGSKPAEVGDLVEVMASRHPDGRWRGAVSVNGRYGAVAVGSVEVSQLSSNYVGVVPKSGHVLGFQRHQGEMEPGEFPLPRWLLV